VMLLGKPAIDGSNFVMMNRGKGAAAFEGSDKTFNTSTWGTVYYSYKINDTLTGINGVKTDNGKSHDVYTIDGIHMKTADSYDKATNGLATGVYIIDGKKVIVK